MHYLFIALFILVLLFYLVNIPNQKKKRHERKRLTAKHVLQKINSFEHEGQILNYLRKVDAFVFEELLLNAFENKGYQVFRNKRYTGDGGIDGKVVINGQMYYIQAKRYSNHINKQHVLDFANVIQQNNVKGLFIHTGRTGKESKGEIYTNDNLILISGSKLISLIKYAPKESQATHPSKTI